MTVTATTASDEPTVADFASILGAAAEEMRQVSPSLFAAVSRFWSTPFRTGALSPKVKELVCLAIHASASTLNSNGIALHVERACRAGATKEEIVDVLASISPLGSHSFSVGIPALLAELKDSGRESDAQLPPMSEEMSGIKEDFIRNRGYWTEQREILASLTPEFFKAYMALSYEPWKSGVLDAKTREFMAIAIDCSITHMYEHGLRIHIRNALKHGASRAEILEIFELCATLGVSTYVAGAKALADNA
jgi:alkylhydroperoxidase/carboxymuconolactone decarboxylase family protein YurZ